MSADCGDLVAADGLDAVVVASPSGRHAADALSVLGAGPRLYLEKPLATTVADGHAVVAADPAGTATIGFNRRLHPVVVVAAETLQSGRLGQVVGAETRFCESGRAPPGCPPGSAAARTAAASCSISRFTTSTSCATCSPTSSSFSVRPCGRSSTEQDDAELRLRSAAGVEAVVAASYHGLRADTLVLRCGAGRSHSTATPGRCGSTGAACATGACCRLHSDDSCGRSRIRRTRPLCARSSTEKPGPGLEEGLRALEVVAAAEAAAG